MNWFAARPGGSAANWIEAIIQRMVTARLPQDEIDLAVLALREGDVIAFPTETVYGLGADAQNPQAIRRIFELKGRPAAHPLIVHIEHPRALDRWALSVPAHAHELAEQFWPGPLTLVLRRAPAVDSAITGGQDTIAMRIPGHPWRSSCCAPSAAASPRHRRTATGT